MYGDLLEAFVEDLGAGGPTTLVLRGHENDPGPSALGLRLLGSLHRLVLTGRAPALERYYPSVGGAWDAGPGTAAVLAHLATEPDAVREWLRFFPQTNEVGRAVALIGGLLHLPEELRQPIRLFEIGSSGGLNLLADRFTVRDTSGVRYGPPDSPVVLRDAWDPAPALTPWPELRFAEATGCDIHPVDTSSPDGAIRLTAYAWPDQPHRLERLRGALALAADHPPGVEQMGAGDFVDRIAVQPGRLSVLWHSVMWQYVPELERQRIRTSVERIGRSATPDAPFALLNLEPSRRTPEGPHEFLIRLTTWPGGTTRILGTGAPHGLPATWES